MLNAESLPTRPAMSRDLGWAAAWLRPWLLCVALGLGGALPMAVLTPPFQVPDEPQHLYRAFQLSELQPRSLVQDGAAGAVLPSSLPELTERFLGTRELHVDRPIPAQPLRETLSELSRPLEPERREFVDFTGAALYSPLPYLPQAAAVALGRWAGAGPLMLLYLGRLANALVAVALLALAVRLMPVGRRAALLAGLLPMAAYLYGSVSPDAAVITTAFLFTAVMLRGQFRGRWTTGEVLAGASSGLVFCSLKPVYAPLLLMGLPAAVRHGRVRHTVLVHAVILVVVVGGTVAWLKFASSALVLPKPGTSLSDQAAHIAGDPLGYLALMVSSIRSYMGFYVASSIGVLGWHNLPLPALAYALPFLALLPSVVMPPRDGPVLPDYAVAWNLLLLAGCVALTMTALYLYWNPVGNWEIYGVQGRYFLPLAALGAVTFCSVVRLRLPWPGAALATLAVAVAIALGLLIAQGTIVRAYHLF